ncbi:MAG: hypothetical protein JWO73_361 [Candidatus Taylorbacteria bacterium]|nr:hypothetical protein [Candidatus Taylorbacteria bacterium]
MDEFAMLASDIPEPPMTIEEIREKLKPYYAEKFAGSTEDRKREQRQATILWYGQLLAEQNRRGDIGYELIG